MWRRSHMTKLGCIACEELSEVGAGNEGWLVDDPNLLLCQRLVAIELLDSDKQMAHSA
jgi:hypothetical protein